MAQRLSQLASELWPFLLPKVSGMVTGQASGGSSSGGGALALHDLNGSFHKGTLADAQAPQFLLRNGARALTGSLAVDAGVTIDGVDLSVHVTDINAHHNKLHSIIDGANHSVIGSQYQVVGLTGINTLGLLTPSSSPGAHALIKTDASSGVTLAQATINNFLYMDGTLDFGTNTIDEDASYLQFAGSKAIRFAQNIGNAAWTVYNTGGAAFGGSVDITGGGDLTVGSNVLFVDNSLAGVGINMAPDPQFALDINGPARATYWIGPHAIQLKNVLLLAHYDGRAPYNTNYTGEPNGHMGQVAAVSGGVIYRPGKFYKALQCGYATTNLVANSSFETGITGWVTDYPGATTITNAPGGYYGSAQVNVVATSSPSNFYSAAVTVTNNTPYAVSFWYKATGTIAVVVREYGNATELSNQSLPAALEWTRYTKVVTTPASGSTTIRIVFTLSSGAAIELDAVQIEAGALVTPYCDGSLGGYSAAGVPDGTGHSWAGTAYASTSTRQHATLRYPIAGNITANKGTIMLWVYADQWNPNVGIIWQAGNANGEFDAYISPAGDVVWRANGTTQTATTGALAVKTWHHLAFTWDVFTNTKAIYVNGVSGGSATVGVLPTLDTGIGVGYSAQTTAIYYHVGYIDDFCILGTVLPADEIKSVYESNAPVFAETSTFNFRPTPKGLIWADDEGLWMRDVTGNAVLGVYGGEAATKSWAGFTMASGDIAFGRNAVGSSAIWWDQSAGKFGFFGAGSVTPQVEIVTDGSLTAGAGAVKLDSTGFKAYNASAVETVNINSNGIYLGDGGARTSIASYVSGNRQRWYNVAESYEATPETYLDDSAVTRTLYPLVMRAIRQGNDAALIELAAVRSDTGAGAKLIIGEGFRLKDYYGTPYFTNRVVHASADSIILEAPSTTKLTLETGALKLAGLTTSAAAVGSYAGKVRINISGTDYYIPYYAS
jgi:hypothetical protein